MTWLVIVAFIVIFLQAWPSIKSQGKKENIVFAVFFIGAFILCFLDETGIKLGSPALGIAALMKKIGLYYP